MKPYRLPTLRQLGRGDLTDEQARWIEASQVRARRRWTLGEVFAFALAALMVVGTAVLCVTLVGVLAGCSGAGALPLVGRESLCVDVTSRWVDRVHACGNLTWSGNYAKCDSEVVLLVSDGARDACFADLDALPCDQAKTLPASCERLFQGGL